MRMRPRHSLLLSLAFGALGSATVSAQAVERDASRPRFWVLGSMGVASPSYRCHSCFLTEGMGGSVETIAAGVRVRRVVGGVFDRRWQSWFAESGGRSETVGGLVGIVAIDNGKVALMPYVGAGMERYRRDDSYAPHRQGRSAVLLGGATLVVAPRRRLSPTLAVDQQGWIRARRSGGLGAGDLKSTTWQLGLSVH